MRSLGESALGVLSRGRREERRLGSSRRAEAELPVEMRGGACSLRGKTLPRVRRMSLEAPGLAKAGRARVFQTQQPSPQGDRLREAARASCAPASPPS